MPAKKKATKKKASKKKKAAKKPAKKKAKAAGKKKKAAKKKPKAAICVDILRDSASIIGVDAKGIGYLIFCFWKADIRKKRSKSHDI